MTPSVQAKADRCISRLYAGQHLYLLTSGQWKFGGNKFVPNRIVQKLPIEEAYRTNDERVAFRLTDEARAALSRAAGER